MDFDALSLPAEPVEEEETPPPPTFSESELKAAQDAAFQAGKAEGFAQANTGFEHQIADTIRSLQSEFTTIAHMQNATNHETMRDSVEVAAMIVRKLFPEYAKIHGLAEIEEFVKATISSLFTEAEVIVRVPEDLAEEFTSRLIPVAAASGLGENLKIVPDPALGPADCRMEWGNGGAERKADQLLSEIELAVERFIEHNEIPPMAIALNDEQVQPAVEDAVPQVEAVTATEVTPNDAEAENQDGSAADGATFALEQQEPQTAEITELPEPELPEPEIAEPTNTPTMQTTIEVPDMQQRYATEIPAGAPEPADEAAIALPAIEPAEEPAPEPAPAPATLPGAIVAPMSEPQN